MIKSPPVVIFLFGAFTVTVNGAPITGFRSNKVRALFAYLLLAPPHLRLMWSPIAS